MQAALEQIRDALGVLEKQVKSPVRRASAAASSSKSK
jgi:hypothetical protein